MSEKSEKLLIIFIIVLVTLLFGRLAWWNSRFNCNRLATDTHLQTKFDWLGQGCFVKVGHTWVQEANYRGITK